MSTTRWDRFQTAVTVAKNLWNSHQNRQFGSAYELAQTRYLGKIEEQHTADLAAAENKAMLGMLALSLAGGSVLATLFGKASAKAVAADLARNTALDVTVRKGWNRAFDALAWADMNAGATFVMGALWDHAQTKVTTKVSEAIKGLDSMNETMRAETGPLQFQNYLENYTDMLESAVLTSGQWMFDETGKDETLDRFQAASPFFKTPRVKVDVEKTADRIELTMWMKYVLDLDYLESGHHGFPHKGAVGHQRLVTARQAIDALPSSKASYPKKQSFEFWDGFGTKRFYEVKYKKAGDLVRTRINELHGRLIGGDLFNGEVPSQRNASPTTLRMAELALTTLAIRNAKIIKAAMQ